MQALPDALRGEQWAFVQLPLGTLQDMLTKVEEVRPGVMGGDSPGSQAAGWGRG